MVEPVPHPILDRRTSAVLRRALESFRIVILNGPRQSGKSTLLQLAHQQTGGRLITLDDRTSLRVAKTDPAGLLADTTRPLYIDEVQRGGDPLILAMKAAVDRDGSPGQFIVAGSSRFLTVPTLSESLAGRARIIDLWPLSRGELEGGEIAGCNDGLLDLLFAGPRAVRALTPPTMRRREVAERIVVGGFPSVQHLDAPRRAEWFDDYRRTLIQRDLTELRRLRHAADVPRLFNLAAARTAQELNVSSYAAALGLSGDIVRDYLTMLETIYVHHLLPGWATGATKRANRRPKLHFVDSGLAADTARVSIDRLADPLFSGLGPLLETFVVGELMKQRSWSSIRPDLFHFRDRDGREVDVVCETRDGLIVGIEIKAALDVDDRDARGLAYLRDRLGERFVQGVVLHLGDRPLPLGDRLTALPVAALWRTTI